MQAQIFPKFVQCACGQLMNVEVTAQIAKCTNPACPESAKTYALPVTTVTLSEKQ